MEKMSHHPILEAVVNWLKNNQTTAFIEQELYRKGLTTEQADKLIKMAKKIIYQSRLRAGTICIVLGALLLLASFMFAMLSNFSDKHFTWGLYGLTGVGATLLVVGIIYIFS